MGSRVQPVKYLKSNNYFKDQTEQGNQIFTEHRQSEYPKGEDFLFMKSPKGSSAGITTTLNTYEVLKVLK